MVLDDNAERLASVDDCTRCELCCLISAAVIRNKYLESLGDYSLCLQAFSYIQDALRKRYITEEEFELGEPRDSVVLLVTPPESDALAEYYFVGE